MCICNIEYQSRINLSISSSPPPHTVLPLSVKIEKCFFNCFQRTTLQLPHGFISM